MCFVCLGGWCCWYWLVVCGVVVCMFCLCVEYVVCSCVLWVLCVCLFVVCDCLVGCVD